jgi:hypothetical protein
MTKDKIPDLGMLRDMNLRERETRTDNHAFRWDARVAYEAIYEDGYQPNSRYIDRILSKKSYVPTKVSINSTLCLLRFCSFARLFHF